MEKRSLCPILVRKFYIMFMADDVAQVFYKAITHRNQSLGECFDAEAATHITLYGYAKHMYEFFGHEPKIKFMPWDKWCEYEGNPQECEHTYYHIARSGVFSIEKAQRLLEISRSTPVLKRLIWQ